MSWHSPTLQCTGPARRAAQASDFERWAYSMEVQMKVMSKIFAILAVSICAHQAALAGCVTSHQECEYQCIEYYPNGTDCKKSKKVCHEVCDDFDVNTSGGTPHVPIKPSSQSTSNSNAVQTSTSRCPEGQTWQCTKVEKRCEQYCSGPPSEGSNCTWKVRCWKECTEYDCR